MFAFKVRQVVLLWQGAVVGLGEGAVWVLVKVLLVCSRCCVLLL